MRILAGLCLVGVCSSAFAEEPHCINPKELIPSVVKIHFGTERGWSSGTGWFWHDGATIVTARHVVADAIIQHGRTVFTLTYNPHGQRAVTVAKAKVWLQSGEEEDRSRDVAVLHLDRELEYVKPLPIAEHSVNQDMWGAVAGYESGKLAISSVRMLGTVKYRGDSRPLVVFTGIGSTGEVPLFEGYSGSPITNCAGEVVSMVSSVDRVGAFLAYKKMLKKQYAERIITNAGPDSFEITTGIAGSLKDHNVTLTLRPAN
jgi:hypothetical protein